MGIIQGLAFLALAASPPPAGRPLAPSGKWMLAVEPDGCLLQRTFGSGAEQVTFGIRRLPLSATAEVQIVSPRQLAGSGIGRVRHTSGMWNGRFGVSQLQNGSWRATAQLPIAEIDGIGQGADLGVSLGRADLHFIDAHFAEAIAAERSCERTVLQAWGVDSAEVGRVTRAAEPVNPATWITDADYPKSAWTNGIVGRVVVLSRIDVSGRPDACKVVASSGNPALDDAPCRLILSRGRYRPALGSDGQPVVSHLARVVDWNLPYDRVSFAGAVR